MSKIIFLERRDKWIFIKNLQLTFCSKDSQPFTINNLRHFVKQHNDLMHKKQEFFNRVFTSSYYMIPTMLVSEW